MSINHRWRNEHIENGNWIHTIGDESYVLRTYHHRTSWDQLPLSIIEDHPQHIKQSIDNGSDTDDSETSNEQNITDSKGTTDTNNESESKQQSSTSTQDQPNDDGTDQSSKATKADHSAKSIALNAENHAAFLDFSGDSFAQKRMIEKWRCELNSFSLRNSSFGCIYDKRYNVLKSLFQHFEKHSNQPHYDPYYQMTHNKYKKHAKPDFSTVKVPMKLWQQIPGKI